MTHLVIGIGNDFRRDDGVGLAVAQVIGQLALPDTRTMTAIGEPGELLDAWAGVRRAVVIDATAGDEVIPGRVRRWTPDKFSASTCASSHSFGLPQAYALGAALGRLPGSLVVFTVDVADTGVGHGLSAEVAAAVPRAAEAVLAELGGPLRSDLLPTIED